jgi:uncharacterized protein (TIGR00369 family)
MTGLELLRAIADGRLPRAPISATLDFDIVAADEGRAEFHGRVGPQHANPMGQVHGGYACTMLDSAMGSAVMSTLPEGASYATAQLSIHLTRSIPTDAGRIVAEARVVHRGRRVATAESTLRDDAGNLLAHGTTTCVIIEGR